MVSVSGPTRLVMIIIIVRLTHVYPAENVIMPLWYVMIYPLVRRIAVIHFFGCQYIPLMCNDTDPCTMDTCDASIGCVYTHFNCTDSNLCTEDFCSETDGCNFEQVICNDNNFCTQDSCDPETGLCLHVAIVCDDLDACTEDLCNHTSGGCYFKPIVNCTVELPPPSQGNPSPDGIWHILQVLQDLMGERAEDVSVSVVASVGVFSVFGLLLLCALVLLLLHKAHPPKADGKYVAL